MRPDLIQVTEWAWEPSMDGDVVVHLCDGEIRELCVGIQTGEVEWLNRAQHPSYKRLIDPLLAHMAGKVLSIELVPDGQERWGALVTYADGTGITSRSVPLTTALLLASRHPVPVVASAAHFEVMPLQ